MLKLKVAKRWKLNIIWFDEVDTCLDFPVLAVINNSRITWLKQYVKVQVHVLWVVCWIALQIEFELMVLTRRSYIEIASYFFNGGTGKVFQINTNVSVARELNPGPWQHLTTIRWKSDGAAGNWTRDLQLSRRMLYEVVKLGRAEDKIFKCN